MFLFVLGLIAWFLVCFLFFVVIYGYFRCCLVTWWVVFCFDCLIWLLWICLFGLVVVFLGLLYL